MFHNALDRHTDPHTDPQAHRWLPGKFDDYRSLTLYRQQRGQKIIIRPFTVTAVDLLNRNNAMTVD